MQYNFFFFLQVFLDSAMIHGLSCSFALAYIIMIGQYLLKKLSIIIIKLLCAVLLLTELHTKFRDSIAIFSHSILMFFLLLFLTFICEAIGTYYL